MLFRLFGKNHYNGDFAVTIDDAHHSPFFGKAERNLGILRYEADVLPDTLLGKVFFKFFGNEKGRAPFREVPQLAHHLPLRKEEPLQKKRYIKTGFALGEFNAGGFSSIQHAVCTFRAIYHLTERIKMQILFQE
jgi:hypothetical protein